MDKIEPKELAEYLKGKTISDIRWHSNFGIEMCVNEIVFTDGTIVKPCGISEECFFDFVIMPDGKHLFVYNN